jgi:ribosomal protein S18 acetylase RimI-like enzyme
MTTPSDVTVVPMTAEMVPEVVQVHFDAFAGYLSARIGRAYVRAFMHWFRQAERGIGLVVTDRHGNVVGYVVGAPVGYNKRMNRDLLWVAAAGIMTRPWLVCSRLFRSKIRARLRLILGRAPVQDVAPELPEPTMSLVGIGVSSAARGKQIGLRLMQAFEAKARELQMRSLQLSVYTDNKAARHLYEQCGWQPFSRPVQEQDALYYFRVLSE